jgi:hypothetical protein
MLALVARSSFHRDYSSVNSEDIFGHAVRFLF